MSVKDIFQKKIKSNFFLRSVLTVTSGTALSQLIVILVSPLITRLYSPTDMGILASYTAITSILGTVIAGCYNQAVVLPDTKRQTNAVVFLGVLIAAVGCGVITLVTIIFDDALINLLNLQSIQKIWFYLLGVFVFFIGADSVLNQYAIKNAHFKLIATTQVTQQIATNGLKVLLGFCKFETFGLLASMLLGQIIRVIRLFVTEFKNLFGIKDDIPSKADVKYVMGRYKKFPLISSWSALLNASSVQLPVILFSSFFSPAVAGAYSLGHKILSLPISLISSSVNNVFLEKMSKIKEDRNQLGESAYIITKKMIFISAVGMSIITIHGKFLFSFVFGKDWALAGEYAQWLSIWLLFVFVSSPLTTLFIILEKQGSFLFVNIVLFVSRFLSIVLCTDNIESADNAIIVFSITGAIVWIGISIYIFKLLQIKIIKALKLFIVYPMLVYVFHFALILLIRGILWHL